MATYRDWISKADTSDQTYFSPEDKPEEPEGEIYPKKTKKITSAYSLSYHDDNGDFNPSEESVLKDGIDPNSGEWNLSGNWMTAAAEAKIREFFETNPPDDEFLFYRARTGLTYLVEILDFNSNWDKIWEVYIWSIKLKNWGVVT